MLVLRSGFLVLRRRRRRRRWCLRRTTSAATFRAVLRVGPPRWRCGLLCGSGDRGRRKREEAKVAAGGSRRGTGIPCSWRQPRRRRRLVLVLVLSWIYLLVMVSRGRWDFWWCNLAGFVLLGRVADNSTRTGILLSHTDGSLDVA